MHISLPHDIGFGQMTDYGYYTLTLRYSSDISVYLFEHQQQCDCSLRRTLFLITNE